MKIDLYQAIDRNYNRESSLVNELDRVIGVSFSSDAPK
jgi:hypothetical protein